MTLDALLTRPAPLLFAARSQCRQHLAFALLKLVVGALPERIQVEHLCFFSLTANTLRSRWLDAILAVYELETAFEPADCLRK
jgi:hypothetical protein